MAQLLIPHAQPRSVPGRATVTTIMSPAPRDIWDGVVRDDPGATALQTPAYLGAVLAATGGQDASRLYQFDDGRQVVVPLVRRRSWTGVRLEAYPEGYGSGGMLATGGLLAEDVRTVVEDLRGHGSSIRIGGAHHTAEAWSAGPVPGLVEVPRRVEVVDLAAGSEVSRPVRQQVRQAHRDGIEIERDTSGRLLPIFSDIYRAEVERWIPRSGLPRTAARRVAMRQEPLSGLATGVAGLGDACRVFVAWHRGRPVAAAISLVHGQHAVGWWSSSIEELAAPVSGHLLTLVSALEDAGRSGCRWFDLGPTGGLAGRQRVTSSLGASRRSVADLRIEPAGLTRLRAVREQAEGVLSRAHPRSPDHPTPG